jgi:ABC-type sugar transport system ATPase subunit
VPLHAIVEGLSTSMQQRVEIAKALSRNAKVLVLDEPTSRLGGDDRRRLFELMDRIAGGGTALMFISHFLEEVLDVTSRVTVLRDGRVVERGYSENYTPSSLSTALLGETLEAQEAKEAKTERSRGGRGAKIFEATDVACGHRVHGASLSLHAGEIVGLAGLMGSGRTTLAKALVGAVPLKAGEIRLRGEPVRFRNPGAALRAGVALVPEDRRAQGLVGVLPARDNMVLMSMIRQKASLGIIRPGALRQLADRAITDFEVRPGEPERPAATFSGGNQQKLLLARAVLSGAEVLIIDQPTAGVDVGTKAQIHRILRALAEEGKAILMLSDEIDELLGLSDRLLVMREGELVAEHDRGGVERSQLITEVAARTVAHAV